MQARAPYGKFPQTMRGGLNSRSGNIAEHKGLHDDLRQLGRNSANLIKSGETQGKYKSNKRGGKKGMHSKNSSRQSEMNGSNRSGK